MPEGVEADGGAALPRAVLDGEPDTHSGRSHDAAIDVLRQELSAGRRGKHRAILRGVVIAPVREQLRR